MTDSRQNTLTWKHWQRGAAKYYWQVIRLTLYLTKIYHRRYYVAQSVRIGRTGFQGCSAKYDAIPNCMLRGDSVACPRNRLHDRYSDTAECGLLQCTAVVSGSRPPVDGWNRDCRPAPTA